MSRLSPSFPEFFYRLYRRAVRIFPDFAEREEPAVVKPHALTDQQLNELANKLWYPIWDSGLDLDQSVRTVAQCEAVTDRDLPAAMGWLDVVPIAGDTGLIESTAVSILERWRKAARKRLPELLGSAKSRLDEFRIGVRARRILACRPSARHV